ncbi:rhomboid family intramembrane serine protease [Candidatus Woesearchaeota archaeon]|nr:rhomboid family intramembrane serine protease [Candidatus Woesearchaeota archaeon]
MNYKTRKSSIGYLLGINAIIYIIQLLVPKFNEMFLLDSSLVWNEPWRLVTSMFMHSTLSLNHLLFNMYALFLFGGLMEQMIGTKRFLKVYFVSGIVAGIIFSIFTPGKAVGASGAIMGILGLTIMLLPNMKVLFFFVIPMSMRTAGIIFALIDILGLFNPYSRIANAAHLGGLVIGLLYGFYLLRQKKNFNKNFTGVQVVSHQGHNYHTKNSQEMTDEDIDNYLKYGRL